ncbi:carboxymethylenebutenolidase [Candidatus Moduliflexus flocculans]|uniref:Carboxymethylenebutenolidase n=1 Tax=Candidatus Moduliflexus flocculans TaxID=1499966 RepID=A0A081BM20_9BACT|nr:carboxymethylenebutenolidase [Candidatus Moduliflexus flocculans]
MDAKVLELQGQYAQGKLSRREFLEKASLLIGSAAALSLMPAIASAEVVPADDARLQIERITYPGETGDIRATLAHPKGDAKLPALIIIHENRGLNPHIEDVGRRFALEGFLTLAPDALSPLGGTPKDPDEAREMIGKLDAAATVKNYVAAVQYLKTHPLSTGKVGCMGFCWGGGMTNQVAVNAADLDAAVPFYGMQPKPEDVPKIKAPLLLHYAGNDERINAGIAAYEDALKKASIQYTLYMYDGAQHAFFNDTSAERYNKEAAQLAWERTLAFLNEKLKM